MVGIEYSFHTDSPLSRGPPVPAQDPPMDVTLPSCHTHTPTLVTSYCLSLPRTCRGCCMLPAPLPPCHPTPFPQSKLGGAREDRHQVGSVTFLNTHGEPWFPFLLGISQHQARLGDGQDSEEPAPHCGCLGLHGPRGSLDPSHHPPVLPCLQKRLPVPLVCPCTLGLG